MVKNIIYLKNKRLSLFSSSYAKSLVKKMHNKIIWELKYFGY